MLSSPPEVYGQHVNYLNKYLQKVGRSHTHTWCLLVSPRLRGDDPISSTVGSRVYGKPHLSAISCFP